VDTAASSHIAARPGLWAAHSASLGKRNSALQAGRAEGAAAEESHRLSGTDYFKLFNYKYGHIRGDDCLRKIRGWFRATDMAARFDGEEFVLLSPETGLDGALVFAEKMRRRITKLALPNNYSTVADHLTASFGAVGARDASDRLVRDIIEQAHRQLHTAKANGRDRVWAPAV
jgi:diguanylate cyclase (GGDEF)-like protein